MTLQQALEAMPQKGAMRLIDDVSAWDARTICCRSEKSIDQTPMNVNQHFSRMLWVEFGAQAGALHAILNGHSVPEKAFIASLKQVNFYENASNSSLLIDAEELANTANARQYQFTVSTKHQVMLCQGLVLVAHQTISSLRAMGVDPPDYSMNSGAFNYFAIRQRQDSTKQHENPLSVFHASRLNFGKGKDLLSHNVQFYEVKTNEPANWPFSGKQNITMI